ncbi:MAG: cytochrome oxidase subunit III [Planctomycetes bacterium]|nr:cytochrome oxidase subunit III [Planctomycetota bacterium]|tara:strand:- start:501 stop:1112 length:612 start_codon:yes stop_codon:yes gene_type:complete
MSFQIPIATSRSATGVPTGRLAVWWIIASEIVIFGGLLAGFLMYRLHHGDEWAAQAAQTKLWCGSFNTFVLLTSSYFVVLAHKAAGEKKLDDVYKYIWWTILGGGIFMCVKFYEYTSKIFPHWYGSDHDPVTITSSVFWSFYFVATGIHGFHVLCGMIIMAIIAHDARKGNFIHRVENIGIYWHFVDLVWIFLFPLFYIASGL